MSDINSIITQVANPNENDDDKEKLEVHAESKGCFDSIFCCFSTCFANWCCCRDRGGRRDAAPHNNNSSNNNEKKQQDEKKTNSVPLTQPTPTVNNKTSNDSKQDQTSKNEQTNTNGGNTVNNNDNQDPMLIQQNDSIKPLLPPLEPSERHKKTLVLDLDETLVHSSFKPIPNADFVISIELESVIHRVYVLKRPGVDNFLREVGRKFEVIVFTASLAKYADPLLDILDRGKVIKSRLFREACVHHYGNYVKDLSHLGRRLENTIIIDNSPFSYMFQPDNAIPISSWFNDKNDRQLYDLLPYLESILQVDDVCSVLQRRKPPTVTGSVSNMQNMQ